MQKKIYKIILVCIMLSMFSMLIPSFGEEKVLRVAGDNNYPPYEFVDEKGEFRGFAVDIMSAVGKEAGYKIEYLPMAWEDAINALENNQVDVIQCMSVTESREEKFAFTDPILENSAALFVRAENTYITSLEDLKGKRIAYQAADVGYEKIKELENVELIDFSNQPEALGILIRGEVDAVVGNRLTGKYILQKEQLVDKIKIVGEDISVNSVALAVSKDNQQLLDNLNRGLRKIKKNSVYDKIYSRWFGELFVSDSSQMNQLVIVLGFVFAVSMLGIVLVIWLNQKLQREVERRTVEVDQSKALLEKSNRQKDNILESITSGIIVIDNKETIIQYNSAARKILKERIKLGQQWKLLGVSEKINMAGYKEALSGKNFTDTMVIERDNGASIHVQYSLIPIKGPEGTEGTILLINDFTSEKGLMDLLSQNDKMNSLSRLSAGIAHELKNPLNSINAYVKKLPNHWDDAEFKSYFMSVVPDEIKRLNVLLMNLLDYTKPNSTQSDYIELDDLFEEVDRLFKQKVVEKRVTFISDAGELVCWGDSSHLKQVLINLVMNSYEALAERGHIHLVATPEKDRVVIKVSDDGCGIEKETLEKVFEPFYTTKSDGTGIGLAICRQLILENDGEINVESEIGKGTTFTIKLPKFEIS